MTDDMIFEPRVEANGVHVLTIRGRLDAQTSPNLHQYCTEARDAGRVLVLNLGEVVFLSSSGIGALLALTKEFREHGGSLRIAEVSPPVKEAIEMLNLASFLEMFEREQDAIERRAA